MNIGNRMSFGMQKTSSLRFKKDKEPIDSDFKPLDEMEKIFKLQKQEKMDKLLEKQIAEINMIKNKTLQF